MAKNGYASFDRSGGEGGFGVDVNPTHVESVVDDGGGQCELSFSAGHSIYVRGTRHAVLEKLNTALEAHCHAGPAGPPGPQGPQGVTGPQGPAGPAGASS